MKPTENPSEIKEFYQNSNAEEVNMCNHHFERLSVSRVICNKCGLGFFDNPFDPFPVDEINKQTSSERSRQSYHKRKQRNKDVDKTI